MRRFISSFIAGAATLMFFGYVPVDAQAYADVPTDAGLSYSTDGINYSAEPPPLFANMPKLTPGEEFEGVLWIRNSRPHAVDFSLQTNLADDFTGILVGTKASGISTLGSGEATAVTVRVWLPSTAGNETQGKNSELIRMTVQASESNPSPTAPEQLEEQAPGKSVLPSPGVLGETGYSAGLLPLALGALVTGGVLFARSRRRPQQSINTARNLL
ncbi:hypothetical protein [Arthrobacter sp. MYb227]|uniref:hypothetical protein n=1 Tax=Arthrobacter sp. MYb227 TaxID=1848601 RepID=UPI0011B043E2|nr:hypothetical protein [Arthrobacter sp. MYb227]